MELTTQTSHTYKMSLFVCMKNKQCKKEALEESLGVEVQHRQACMLLWAFRCSIFTLKTNKQTKLKTKTNSSDRSLAVSSLGNPAQSICDCFHFHCLIGFVSSRTGHVLYACLVFGGRVVSIRSKVCFALFCNESVICTSTLPVGHSRIRSYKLQQCRIVQSCVLNKPAALC